MYLYVRCAAVKTARLARTYFLSFPKMKNAKIRTWILPIGALISLWVVLLTRESSYLFRVQELNLFLYSPLFFRQQMAVPGGLLHWLGAYFTQFFYHPALGVGLLCSWWGLLMWLIQKTFRLSGRWTALLFVPVSLLLINDFDLGYWIFYLKSRGFLFSPSIGCCLTVALLWLYRSLKSYRLRLFLMPLSSILLYPLTGVYVLLAVFLMAVWESVRNDKSILKAIGFSLSLLSIGLIPLFYCHTIFCQTAIANCWHCGLPHFHMGKLYFSYYLPYLLLVIYFLLMILFEPSRQKDKPLKKGRLFLSQLFVLALCFLSMELFRYKDQNFYRETDMTRSIEKLDWESVLNVYQSMGKDEYPTRTMWMMKNLALFRLGKAGDKMFHYKNGDMPNHAPFQVRLVQTGGKLLYFHYGKLNFCHRWCMEDGVEYGWRVEYLKLLLKCSLLNGEYDVAQKYANLLKQTKYHRAFALQYEKYIQQPSSIKENAEFQPILHFLQGSDALTSDNAFVEVFLLNSFSNEYSNDPLCQEWMLLTALQQKDIQLFWSRFFQYAQLHQGERMPVHYQEAAYLYGHLEKQIDISNMPFDEQVKKHYDGFMKTIQAYPGYSNEQLKQILYPSYGNTFYYEYFFIRNQQSY